MECKPPHHRPAPPAGPAPSPGPAGARPGLGAGPAAHTAAPGAAARLQRPRTPAARAGRLCRLLGVLVWLLSMPAVAVTAAPAGAVPPPAGDATGLLYEFRAGSWLGGAYREPPAGPFSHCQVERRYEDGTRLRFGIDRDQALVMFLRYPGWQLEPGTGMDVALQIDDRVLGRFSALGDRHLLAVRLGGRRDVFAELTRGRRLQVETPAGTVSLALTDAREALRRVRECVNLAAALPPGRPGSFADRLDNPYAQDRPPYDSSGQAPSRAERDLLEAWGFLLEQAGLGAFEFLHPASISPEAPPVLAWQSIERDVLGLLHIFPGGDLNADAAIGLTLMALAEDCEGGYYSGGLPARRVGAYVLKAGSIECVKASGTVYATAAAIVERSAVQVVVHIAHQRDAVFIQEVNARLLEVVASLLAGSGGE